MNLHQEHHFEREICAHLSAQGWLHAESADVGLQLLAETQISERPNHGFADLPAIEAEGTAAEASLKALRQQMLDKLPEDWADDNTGVVRLRRSRMCRKPLRSGVVRELI